MYTKVKIFNLALGALLLSRQITDADNDTSNEARVLRTHYEVALNKALEDMDLDGASTQVTLALLDTEPDDFLNWRFVYSYPTNCALLRRIKTDAIMDNRDTHEPKLVRLYGSPPEKAIFCNLEDAVAEIIPNDLPLTALSANAGMAIAYMLAWMSVPLIVGKGADRVKKELWEKYMVFRAQAQAQDRNENFNYIDERVESEFVSDRMS